MRGLRLLTDQPPGHDYRTPTPEEHKARLQEAASLIEQLFPGWGFALLVYEFGETPDRLLTYISNSRRPDVVLTMQEWIGRQSS